MDEWCASPPGDTPGFSREPWTCRLCGRVRPAYQACDHVRLIVHPDGRTTSIATGAEVVLRQPHNLHSEGKHQLSPWVDGSYALPPGWLWYPVAGGRLHRRYANEGLVADLYVGPEALLP